MQPIPKYPRDLLIKLFEPLSPKDLSNCSEVCSEWNHAVNEIWRRFLINQNRFDVIDDFSPLVAEKVLTWRGAAYLSPLSELFAKSFSTHRKDAIRYGNCTFTIVNSSDVEMKINGSKEIQILEGEKGIQLTHLSVDGKFLFVLNKKRIIKRWDYKAKKIVGTIVSAYADYDHIICREFKVKEDVIVVMWGSNYDDFSVCEIIGLNTVKSILITHLPKIPLIKYDKLFSLVQKQKYLPREMIINQIVFDLYTGQQTITKIELDRKITEFDVQNNVICASTNENELIIIDAISGKILHFNYEKSLKSANNIKLIGNLCIRLFKSSESEGLVVININTWKYGIIPDCFDSKNNTIKYPQFAELVMLCKNNQRLKQKSSHCTIA